MRINKLSLPVFFHSKLSQYLSLASLFILFLLYFVFGSGWYAASELVVKGRAMKPGTMLKIDWDSGQGFNSYERERFRLDMVMPEGASGHQVIIRRAGEKNAPSQSSEVVCNRISIDNQDMDLTGLISSEVYVDVSGLHFRKPGAEIRLNVDVQERIYLEFLTNNHSGIVEIIINGRKESYDLYVANVEAKKLGANYWVIRPDGNFTVTMSMPRYPVNVLLVRSSDRNRPIIFQSIAIVNRDKEKYLPVDQDKPVTEVCYTGFDPGTKCYLNSTQFLFQLLFAALSTWIVAVLFRLVQRNGGLRGIFLLEKRYIFWLFFLGAVLVFSIWLIAFWPGVMSVDSLKVWRAAKLPEVFLNDHPILNVIFYMYLIHLWDHIAVVPVIHILLASLLGSYIFFSLYRQKVHIALLLPFYLFFIFSIPVGLYNIVLWKDIPFALLVVLWAYILADMYRRKREGTLNVSKQTAIALFLLYLAVGLIRHNGILYLVVIPVLMILMRIISIKRGIFFLAVSLLVGVSAFAVVRSASVISDTGYFFTQSRQFIKGYKINSIGKQLKRVETDYWGILNINQQKSKWDLWHYYLHDRYAYNFLKHAGWNDIYNFLRPNNYISSFLYHLGLKIYWLTYKKPWVYFSWNPIFVLVLFPLVLVLFRWLPLSAVFSSIIVCQVFGLLFFVNTLNWRYYYFVVFASYFLLPILLLDIRLLVRQPGILKRK
jgi:hypothetical protein